MRGGRDSSANSGFTLLELIMVVSLLSLLLVWVTPRIALNASASQGLQHIRTLSSKIEALKRRAFIQQRQLHLHIDPTANRLWVTDKEMSPDEAAKAKAHDPFYQLSAEWQIRRLTHPGSPTSATAKRTIVFYPQGHSEAAVIELENRRRQIISLRIEPFLSQPRISEE